MSRFRDPRDHVDVRRTIDRKAFDVRVKAAAAKSRERRAAEAELSAHDPDRLTELIAGAQDAAVERAREATSGAAMIDHDKEILPGDCCPGEDMPDLDDVLPEDF